MHMCIKDADDGVMIYIFELQYKDFQFMNENFKVELLAYLN